MPTRTRVERETVERLRVALGITSRYLRSTEAGEGLTPTELSILATISRRGSLRLTELAEIERVNPTMLSRIAGRLTEAQLILREADADDRRAARVQATPAGLALHERIRAQRRESLAAHLDELSDHEVQALLAALPALEALAEGLRRDAPGSSSGHRT
jgi:DNA-binding MarR family transcriptional regulator